MYYPLFTCHTGQLDLRDFFLFLIKIKETNGHFSLQFDMKPMLPNKEYVLMGTERQDSMTRPYFKQIATLSGEYKKIIFPFLHPESKEATSEAVSLHSFCIRASPVSRCTLQVGPSVDGLLCNTCLSSTCGSKVHQVPFVTPLVVLGGHQRLVSRLLSSVNTSVDGGERRN